MKPYKKVFKESDGSSEVGSEFLAKQLVDISNLIWSGDIQPLTWNDAISKCPSGWRLPTIQELYSAQTIPGFKSKQYWSLSTYTEDISRAWNVNFGTGGVNVNNKTNSYHVRYVKEINSSYEDKIESLLVKHLKQNYSKSPKEIEAIEYFISSVLDDLEYTEFTMVEANKMLMLCKRFLGVI